jgi:hypothetical protein
MLDIYAFRESSLTANFEVLTKTGEGGEGQPRMSQESSSGQRLRLGATSIHMGGLQVSQRNRRASGRSTRHSPESLSRVALLRHSRTSHC